MKKRPFLLLVLFLCLAVLIIVLLCFLPGELLDPPKQPDPFDARDLKYRLQKDGTLKIDEYKGNAEKIILPSEFEGKRISCIGWRAFRDCMNLTSITLPDSITTIGCRAFDRCEKLAEIVIPESVTAIEESAFYDCKSLTSIRIPDRSSSRSRSNSCRIPAKSLSSSATRVALAEA